MKNIFKSLLLGSILLGSYSFTLKESPKDILIRLNKVYLNKSYQMNYEVTSKNTITTNVLSSYKGKVAKQGKQHYIEVGRSITILNKKHYLYIDHSQKIMVLNNLTKTNKENTSFDVISWLDSSLNKFKLTYRSQLNGNHIIEIDTKEQSYKKILIYVDVKNYQLKKISYLFANGQYAFDNMTVTYTNIKFGKKIDKSIFSIKPYIKTGLKTKPVKKYAHYQFIDQRKVKTQ